MSSDAPSTKKSWFARHKILTALLIIFGLIIVASALGGESDDAQSPTPTTPAATSADEGQSETDAGSADDESDEGAEKAADEGSDEAEAPQAGLGEAVEAGDFTVTITGVTPGVERIGDEYFGEDASGQFVILDVEVTNTQNEAEYFFDDDITLVDDQGRKHSSSSQAWLLDGNILMEKINPGVTQTGQILFDIPADAAPTSVAIDSGFFSSPIEVSLR